MTHKEGIMKKAITTVVLGLVGAAVFAAVLVAVIIDTPDRRLVGGKKA